MQLYFEVMAEITFVPKLKYRAESYRNGGIFKTEIIQHSKQKKGEQKPTLVFLFVHHLGLLIIQFVKLYCFF